jgi:RHS repeat-associated protein
LQRTDSNGARSLLTDPLGTTLALSDGTGTIQTQYSYDPFGNVTASGQTSTNPYQFTGRENDATGLYYYRARYYAPHISAFVSQDPLALDTGSLPLYQYAAADPIELKDPLGLYTCLYFVSAHSLTCIPNDPNDPLIDTTNVTSGTGPCRDKPGGCQRRKGGEGPGGPSGGPIPSGNYDIGATDWANGTPWIPLSPQPGTDTFGRHGFYIHGCGDLATCSTGCIGVHSNQTRDLLGESLDKEPGSNVQVRP